jgi:hypothetical protein
MGAEFRDWEPVGAGEDYRGGREEEECVEGREES